MILCILEVFNIIQVINLNLLRMISRILKDLKICRMILRILKHFNNFQVLSLTILRLLLRILNDLIRISRMIQTFFDEIILISISRLVVRILNTVDYFQVHSFTLLRVIFRTLKALERISKLFLKILNTVDYFQIHF